MMKSELFHLDINGKRDPGILEDVGLLDYINY